MKYKSLPTIERNNFDKYMVLARTFDPELYLIRQALNETGVSPLILPRVIRAMANIAYGTGFGKVQIFIENKKVSAIKPEESDQLNIDVLIENIFDD